MKRSPSACLAILLFSGSGPATPVLLAQRLESQKDKSITIPGVEIKKDAPSIGGNWHYQMDLINRTNETMVVDVEVRFSNDEISETFEDSISLDPGQSANRDWVTKVHGTRNNTLVLYGLKKLLVRSTRQVAEQKQFEAERLNREFAQKTAADYARQRGIIIADTKFEFGRTAAGITLADEALTPDSSRFWPLDTYAPGKSQNSYDKQFVRDYLESIKWNKQPPAPALPVDVAAKTSEKYVEAYRHLTGHELHG